MFWGGSQFVERDHLDATRLIRSIFRFRTSVEIELVTIAFAILTVINLREFAFQDCPDKSARRVTLLLQFVQSALQVLWQLNHNANKPRHNTQTLCVGESAKVLANQCTCYAMLYLAVRIVVSR